MTTWKPGDLLTDHTGARLFKIEVSANTRTAWRSGACLVSPDGNGRKEEYHPGLRPLVVIDPESAEDVKRFDDLLGRFINGTEVPDYEGTLGCTRAALREFADPTPPKPAEPTGLGAVAEDAAGQVFTRTTRADAGFYGWRNADAPHNQPLVRWDDVEVVRVLSEGVTP